MSYEDDARALNRIAPAPEIRDLATIAIGVKADRELAALKAELARINKKLMDDLTPSGSEFHNDPDRCIAFAKERMESFSMHKVAALKAENAALRERLALADNLLTRAAPMISWITTSPIEPDNWHADSVRLAPEMRGWIQQYRDAAAREKNNG